MRRNYLILAGVAVGVLVVGLAVSALPKSASAGEAHNSRDDQVVSGPQGVKA